MKQIGARVHCVIGTSGQIKAVSLTRPLKHEPNENSALRFIVCPADLRELLKQFSIWSFEQEDAALNWTVEEFMKSEGIE